jgi:DNA-binding transcriptional regulator YhcF (GntR family)
MKLDLIYQQSAGVLSHTERDFYLGFCSFANYKTGFCHPKLKTVAERVGVVPQAASRYYKKLVETGFIQKVPGGYVCLVGYSESKHDVNFSDKTKRDVKSENAHPAHNSKHHVNTTKHGVNSPIYDSSEPSNSTPHSTQARAVERIVFSHPALVEIRKLTLSSPSQILWPDLCRAIGVDVDVGKLRLCFKTWVGQGFKEKNFGWVTDWYANGIPDKYTRNGKQESSARPANSSGRSGQAEDSESTAATLRRIGSGGET